MTLLTEVMTRTLDPGYAAAAQRRSDQGDASDRGTRGRSPVAVVVLVLVGLLLAMAFLQTRVQRPAGVGARDQLVAEITRQDAAASTLQAQNAAARATLDAASTKQLEQQAQGGLADEVAMLGLVTGALAATGPGITVTVDDAASASEAGSGADPRTDREVEDGRVLDQDLQLVVNGLWGAGAEAVAINGQRLTALSAIRSAGQAILVDYRPLSPPYRISAIGDPGSLQSRFSGGAGGRSLQYLQDNFGVRATVVSAQKVTLPANAGVVTRRARPVKPATKASPTVQSSRKATSAKERARILEAP